ncbi:tail tubular protein A [Synechococcus phage P60]|uniref:Tail tubular protein A n=1 Tax=Synechococcus phage P60 TaxID=2905923 RepID=L0CNR2_9CAUD|nr:tail tubular protein A [Synechococcus phage P60]AGA17888.1 tail tubular protein A [Synechococcus phage P60]
MAPIKRTSELDALNVMLTNIGQQPIVNINNTNPQVALAKTVLNQVTSDVLTEGWIFNRELDYPLTPNSDNEFLLPENVVSWDLRWPTDYDVVIRNGKLYDKRNHTYKFDVDELKLDIVWLFDFEDIPNAIRNYITIRASNLFAMRTTGSTEIAKYGQMEEQQARATALDYETQQGDWNVFQNPDGTRSFRGYVPTQTLWRF